MKCLQDIVPGCNKVTGKAGMLDEIINYVQSLQQQVEFLSMKLSFLNPQLEFHINELSSMMADPRSFPLHRQGSLDYSVLNSNQTTSLNALVIIFSLATNLSFLVSCPSSNLFIFFFPAENGDIFNLGCSLTVSLQQLENRFSFQFLQPQVKKLGIRVIENSANFYLSGHSLCYLKIWIKKTEETIYFIIKTEEIKFVLTVLLPFNLQLHLH